ncbi:hypothetical protein ACIRP3_29325 [Streptomyces sp. NPDC101209]|uniref:hypothetical protein n=1 Tax=Streptomyces sp. NPDC101209 TaxID=3366129 RepID=UPI00382CBA10
MAELETLDEDELYSRLGGALLGDGYDFGPSDGAEYAEFARRWLKDRLNIIQQQICGRREIRALRGTVESNFATEVATMTDFLASVYGKPPASIIAVILARRGLNSICREWHSSHPDEDDADDANEGSS